MNNKVIELAITLLEKEEGFRPKPYYCTEGYPTYGIGFKIGGKGDPLPNISITLPEARQRLSTLVKEMASSLATNKSTSSAWASCDDIRKVVMISMGFQLGITKLVGFKATLAAIATKDWDKASREMLDSLAARQTPARWKRQSDIMKYGRI